jgi:hypothetical protein
MMKRMCDRKPKTPFPTVRGRHHHQKTILMDRKSFRTRHVDPNLSRFSHQLSPPTFRQRGAERLRDPERHSFDLNNRKTGRLLDAS